MREVLGYAILWFLAGTLTLSQFLQWMLDNEAVPHVSRWLTAAACLLAWPVCAAWSLRSLPDRWKAMR